MKQDLSRRFNRFKVSDDTLASMKSMRDARDEEPRRGPAEAGGPDQRPPQAGSRPRRTWKPSASWSKSPRPRANIVFDDSQLARAKELIGDIRTRLDVAAKLANADVNVEVEIPLDEATPSDITDQVAEYFKLNGDGDVEVAAASFIQE